MAIPQTILTIIQKCYGSLEQPNFAFVQETVARAPYRQLVHELAQQFDLIDHTDLNYEVCFAYLLSRQGRQWFVELSMLGTYAVVRDLDQNTIIESPKTTDPDSREISTLLEKHGLTLLPQSLLQEPIAITLTNVQEHTCLYNALFADVEPLWE